MAAAILRFFSRQDDYDRRSFFCKKKIGLTVKKSFHEILEHCCCLVLRPDAFIDEKTVAYVEYRRDEDLGVDVELPDRILFIYIEKMENDAGQRRH